MGIMNNPNEMFICNRVDGKGGQNGIFSVLWISEFYPLDFEQTFYIFLCILNLMMNSIMIFVDILKVIDKTNLEAVLLAQNANTNIYQWYGISSRS